MMDVYIYLSNIQASKQSDEWCLFELRLIANSSSHPEPSSHNLVVKNYTKITFHHFSLYPTFPLARILN